MRQKGQVVGMSLLFVGVCLRLCFVDGRRCFVGFVVALLACFCVDRLVEESELALA